MGFLPEGEIKRSKFTEASSPKQDSGKPMDEGMIKALIDMGFSRERSIEALKVCDWNQEHATNYLLQGGSQ